MTNQLVARFSKYFSPGNGIDIDFTQPADNSNVTVLLGPSGCGKTTFLRCLSGLIRPDQGHITFGGLSWYASGQNIALPPQERNIGFLFQEYALFPHLTVAQNIGFSLRRKDLRIRNNQVNEMLRRFDLQGLESRRPAQLSGGQQQRVALARALARKPSLLLLDEPLSALDSLLREQLRNELRRILMELGIPVILVTHDRTEAIALADRVAVMNEGAIQQIGTVSDVFTRPKNASLARLVGVETIESGEIVGCRDGLATVQVGQVQLVALSPETSERFVHVCIKGEDVALQRASSNTTSVRNHLTGMIRSITPEGPLVRVGLDCGFELTSLITRPAQNELHLTIGDSVVAMIKAPAIHLVPRVTTKLN